MEGQTNGVITTESHPNAYDGWTGEEEQRPDDARGRLLKLHGSQNIAADLSSDELALIGSKVVREFTIDKSSRADWETRIKDAMDLAMQVAEEKHYPWPKASNVKYPLVTTAAIQFAARAYPAIVSGSNVVKGKVIGYDGGVEAIDPSTGQPIVDPETGEAAWQVEPGQKRARADRVGRHMSWQLTEEMEEWDEDTDKLLHILPIVGCCFRKTWFDPSLGRNRSELVTADNLVVNYNTRSLPLAPRITQIFKLLPHEIIERTRQGLYRKAELGQATDAEGDDDAPHEFLEQHRSLDLDKDGYPEPYIVTVHKDTSQVVRIVPRFELEGVLVNRKGEISKIEPTHYFTKYGFLPSPDGGFYDIGFGILLNPLNEAVNSTLNQMIDAGTLQNTGGGFLGGDFRIRGGNARFRPGEWKRVDASGGTLRENVLPLPSPGPSAVLFNLLGLLIEAAKDISSVKDVMTGDAGPQNEAATRTLARIEQGLKVFTAIYKRVYRSLKQEYRKLYRLNAIYLEERAYFMVLDQQEAILRQDYAIEGTDIVPVADPTVVSDMQKLAKADILMQFANDPFFKGRKLRQRFLEAANIEDPEDLLIEGETPPVPPEVAEAADKLEIEKRKVELDAIHREAQIAEIESKIILNLAKAEAEEAGPQLQAYKEEMRALIEGIRATRQANGNQSAGLRGVAGQPGNAGGPQVPAGLPGAA